MALNCLCYMEVIAIRLYLHKTVLTLLLYILLYNLLSAVKLPRIFKGLSPKKLRLGRIEDIIFSMARKEGASDSSLSGINRLSKRINRIISLSHRDLSVYRILWESLGMMTIGGLIGYWFRSSILIIVFSVISGVCPLIIYHREVESRLVVINQQLPMVLGSIIAQYMSEESFVLAVEKRLDQIPNPIHGYFSTFVNQIQVLNYSPVDALLILKERIDSFHFKEFVELVIQSETHGGRLKETMLAIPEDMRGVLDVQEEFDLIRKRYNRDFIASLIFFPLNLLILRFGYQRYYSLLVQTLPGRLGLLVIVIILFACTIRMFGANSRIRVEV